MMSGDTSLSGPSTLHDEAFFDPASVEIGLDFMVHRCLTQERSQVLIDAPKLVDPSARTLPVLGVWCRTNREDLAIRWTDRASVVAVRLDDGAAAAGRVTRWKQSELTPDALDEDPGEGFTADGFVCDLYAQLPDLARDGGAWSVTVMVARYRSQTLLIQVQGAPPPRVEAPSPPTTGQRFPSYLPSASTPAVPRVHGIAMDPSRVVVLAPETHGVLTGSLRLPVEFSHPTPEGATAHGAPCARVAPITLVSTRDDALEPHAATLWVPCAYDPTNPSDVTGVFSVDLFALENYPRAPGELRLWAFAGDLVEGPFPMELVDEDELAPR